jgi:hypothetical protein
MEEIVYHWECVLLYRCYASSPTAVVAGSKCALSRTNEDERIVYLADVDRANSFVLGLFGPVVGSLVPQAH